MKVGLTNCSVTQRMLWALGVVLTASAVMLQLMLPAGMQLKCRFHDLTGLPCPTCGSSRSLALLMEGRIPDAFHLQPLLTCIILLLIPALAYFIPALLLNWPLPRIQIERGRIKYWLAAPAALMAANWIYLCCRQI